MGQNHYMTLVAEQAQKMESVARLTGGIAHDFNNMLSIILGYGELILDALHPKDPLREDVQEMVSAGQRSKTLVQQLLAFSRKQAPAAQGAGHESSDSRS